MFTKRKCKCIFREKRTIMFTVNISASELAKITEQNLTKPKDILIENISQAIKEASGQGKRECYYPMPHHDFFCCDNTDLAIEEFINNGYQCKKYEDWKHDLFIHVEW